MDQAPSDCRRPAVAGRQTWRRRYVRPIRWYDSVPKPCSRRAAAFEAGNDTAVCDLRVLCGLCVRSVKPLLVYGINPVLEALKARRVMRLRVGARRDKRIDEVIALAGAQRVAIERADARALDRAANGG